MDLERTGQSLATQKEKTPSDALKGHTHTWEGSVNTDPLAHLYFYDRRGS